ncbi:5762_t:CDS:10, partial [Funneliformis caledonium]
RGRLYTTPDEKVEQLITKLTKSKFLYALKLLFENLQNKFSSQILVDSLRSLANPTLFDHHSMEIFTRLELHLRTLIVIGKEIRDKIYNSLTKFAEFHRKNIQVIGEGLVSGLKSKYNPSNQQNDKDNKGIEKHNYNIDFLLILLRDTLHSLRDDETWFQEILRRTKEFLKAVLNIAPGITIIVAPGVALPNDNCSILSMLTQLRQGLSFKYPVAAYYIWRIMLIIRHNLLNWSVSDEKIICRKFGERILMEYFWSFIEREWNSVADKTMLNSQTKFDEVSNKLFKTLRNTGGFLNDLAGNEPLALPNILWFGILDLAQNLIQKSTQPILDIITDEMTCPISLGLEDQFYLLNVNIRYHTIHDTESNPNLDQTNKQHEDDSEDDSDNSEVDQIIIKKMNLKAIKLKLDILQSKKVRPAYQNVINKLANKNYEKAISIGQVYLREFPNSYTMRCILAYTCRFLNYYDRALSFLDEAISLKQNKPIAYFIRGEILFRQGLYDDAIKQKEIILIICMMSKKSKKNKKKCYDALKNYEVALQKDPRNYLCLKYCAYIYETQEKYSEALEMLDKILINQDDSLLRCYYGEILNYLGRYNDSISHITKAYNIDPENTHILIKKAFTHYELKEYENALSDLNELMQLNSSYKKNFIGFKKWIQIVLSFEDELLNKDCSVEFIVKEFGIHSLKYNQLSALIGLGWIEYTLPLLDYKGSQLSINLKRQIDYVRLKFDKSNEIDIPNNPLQIYKSYPNIPVIFNDKYFSKKEMENLIELKDII